VMRIKNSLACLVFIGACANSAVAADVAYSFSTGQVSPGGFSSDGSGIASSIAAQLTGGSLSGSFLYDAASPATGSTGPGGSLDTRGTVYSVPTGTVPPHSSFNALSGSLSGAAGGPFSFTDPRGFTIVGDNAFQGTCLPQPCTPPPLMDFFGLQAESSNAAQGVHNISVLTINVGGSNYSLFNARFFWIEGQVIQPNTAPIPDFLSSNNLLATPPSFLGRLALDFVATGNSAGPQYSVFFDGLAVAAAVPEPETYAMLVAGFGLLGFVARRRKKLRA
jgi:hypothetical protein